MTEEKRDILDWLRQAASEAEQGETPGMRRMAVGFHDAITEIEMLRAEILGRKNGLSFSEIKQEIKNGLRP